MNKQQHARFEQQVRRYVASDMGEEEERSFKEWLDDDLDNEFLFMSACPRLLEDTILRLGRAMRSIIELTVSKAEMTHLVRALSNDTGLDLATSHGNRSVSPPGGVALLEVPIRRTPHQLLDELARRVIPCLTAARAGELSRGRKFLDALYFRYREQWLAGKLRLSR